MENTASPTTFESRTRRWLALARAQLKSVKETFYPSILFRNMKLLFTAIISLAALTGASNAGLRYNNDFYESQQNWDQYFYDQQIQQQFDRYQQELNAYYQCLQALRDRNLELQGELEDQEEN